MKYKLPDYIFLLCVSGIMINIGNAVGYKINAVESIPGILILLGIILAGVLIHLAMPGKLKSFPIIGWITLVGVLLTVPGSPVSAYIVEQTSKINLLATATPVLAYAGISLGKDMAKLKQVGWKIALVAILVFGGTFLGSAVVAHTVLKLQGLI
ncbi:hypothetical protein LJB99_01465 [Deltaproteobacteria bacterium OttesenSCG-928-K17]|nr:hypothetical protein [Deltaproteobacteria bacterium OttesenSCG-928-K17]